MTLALSDTAVGTGHADANRRRRPRIIDADWLVLKGMAVAIGELAAKAAGPGKSVIDFGCGSRPYEPLFTEAGCTYQGADFDGPSELRIDPDGKLPAASGSADVVLSVQVLEHVRDLETYFGEARRVLKSDGRLLLSTHGTWLYHPHPEDHRRWTRQGLIGDIERHGFSVMECRAVVGPLAWTTIVRLTCWCFALKRVPLIGGLLAATMSLIMNLRAVLEEAITPAWVTDDNACVYVTLCRPAP